MIARGVGVAHANAAALGRQGAAEDNIAVAEAIVVVARSRHGIREEDISNESGRNAINGRHRNTVERRGGRLQRAVNCDRAEDSSARGGPADEVVAAITAGRYAEAVRRVERLRRVSVRLLPLEAQRREGLPDVEAAAVAGRDHNRVADDDVGAQRAEESALRPADAEAKLVRASLRRKEKACEGSALRVLPRRRDKRLCVTVNSRGSARRARRLLRRVRLLHFGAELRLRHNARALGDEGGEVSGVGPSARVGNEEGVVVDAAGANL